MNENTKNNPFNQQVSLPGVDKIIAIGSGKGGVGKSSVSCNLATMLAENGHKVGLLDADIYGPSQPRLFGLLNQKPEVLPNKKMLPIERHGVKVMSIGFIVDPELAVVWRGPMLFKAMNQFLFDVEWGELDYLLVDLPPGTGDVQLSLAQKVKMQGAVIVSTPQNLSLIDAKKSIDMFDRTGIPVLGFIENMSYLENPDGNKMELFPPGEINEYLDHKKIEKLAELPFSPTFSKSCEAGLPFVLSKKESTLKSEFNKLAGKI